MNSLIKLSAKRSMPQELPQRPKKRVKINEELQEDPLQKVLSWRHQYKSYIHPDEGTYKICLENSLSNINQNTWGKNYQGIFINIDWNKTPLQQFKKLQFNTDLFSNGIIFIWGSKTNIGQLMEYFLEKDIIYVENFVFACLSRDKIKYKKETKPKKNTLMSYFTKKVNSEEQQKKENKKQQQKVVDYDTGIVKDAKEIFMNKQSPYFKQTQKVLYLFRKQNKKESLQLRHQRTSDAFFTIGESLELDYKSKEIVYKMIETLLIKANYIKGCQLKLLELWGQKQRPRKGWTTVSFQ